MNNKDWFGHSVVDWGWEDPKTHGDIIRLTLFFQNKENWSEINTFLFGGGVLRETC
jgi:hypothetical protein